MSTLSFLTTSWLCALMSPDKRSHGEGTGLWQVRGWQIPVRAGGHSQWHVEVSPLYTPCPISCFLLQGDGLEFSRSEFTLCLPNSRTLTPGTPHQLVLDEQESMTGISSQLT